MLRIMVVDDNWITSAALESQILKLGHDVVATADRGEAAVRMAAETRPDLIFMDIVLADRVSGVDAALAIRSVADTDIAFVTGYSDPEVRERAAAVNPIGFLLKPIVTAEVEQVLRTAEERQRAAKR